MFFMAEIPGLQTRSEVLKYFVYTNLFILMMSRNTHMGKGGQNLLV